MAVDTGSQPPIQIGKELELVKHYVMLGIVMRILDHDIRIIGSTATKLPRLYESILRGLQDRVLLELANMRRQFRESGIQVNEEIRSKEGLTAIYRCRGYQHTFSFLWTFVKAEAERLLKAYTVH
ncbi:hypothetical protein Back11_04380 [Paenibacillus baekrokdamisoli]|uniref:Uncharacterized protein n=1 Tax=Paenibacillus baekrokdamisoli TaxID=1712516 RepID=A0A3G9J309_9BACL|nr:hypothetical protein [Paenibacillus baekrokdamisoli]MBB3067724.1 hypothetical protein [Paenibacillus baekrokdamisoli]BBH19093.1 hypothetical protein Back11_04380 [Paenibacillus baekrokdamisoli]